MTRSWRSSQAAANAAPGITHIGLQTDDLVATVAQVRRAGVTLDDPRPTNGIGSRLATVFDPHGIRLEINEQPAGLADEKGDRRLEVGQG